MKTKMKVSMKRVLFIVSLLLVPSLSSWGYEGGEVKDGGGVKGKIKITGAIPQDETIKVTKDQQVCGETLPREKYVISSDGGVQNAVVLIEGINKGKPIPKEEVEIDNDKCRFKPHVQAGVTGQTMVVKNGDPMLHNTHMYLDKKTIFNAALPRQGMEIKKPIPKTGIVEIHCDAHQWMLSYLYVADHPYITVTDANGNFSIKDIPPGTYKLKVWHEALGTQEKSITITSKGTLEETIEYKK